MMFAVKDIVLSGWATMTLMTLASLLLRLATGSEVQPVNQAQASHAKASNDRQLWKQYVHPGFSAAGQHMALIGAPGSANSLSVDARFTGQPLKHFMNMNYELGVNVRPLADRDRLRFTQFNLSAKQGKTQIVYGSLGKTVYEGSRFVQPPRTLRGLQVQRTMQFGGLGFYSNHLSQPNRLDKALWGFVYEPPAHEQRKLKIYHFSAKDEMSEQHSSSINPGKGTILGLVGESKLSAAITCSGEFAFTRRDSDLTDKKEPLSGFGGVLNLKGEIAKTNFHFGFSHLGSDFGNALSPATSEDRRLLNASVDRQFSRVDTRFTFNQSQTNPRKKGGHSTQRRLSLETSSRVSHINPINMSWQHEVSTSGMRASTYGKFEAQLRQPIKINGLSVSTEVRQIFFSNPLPGNADYQTTVGLKLPWQIKPLLFDMKLDYDRVKHTSGQTAEVKEAQLATGGTLWQGIPWVDATLNFDMKFGYKIAEDKSGLEVENKMMRVGLKSDFWAKLLSLDVNLGILATQNSAGTSRSQMREYNCELKLKPPVSLLEKTLISVQARGQRTLDFIDPHRSRRHARVAISLSYAFDF